MRDRDRKDVKFSFYCYEKESADLKIRLNYDNLKQSEFFRAIIKMYINSEPEMLVVLEKIKHKKRKLGKLALKRARKDFLQGQEMLENLGITKKEREEIFDIIEMNLEKQYE